MSQIAVDCSNDIVMRSLKHSLYLYCDKECNVWTFYVAGEAILSVKVYQSLKKSSVSLHLLNELIKPFKQG